MGGRPRPPTILLAAADAVVRPAIGAGRVNLNVGVVPSTTLPADADAVGGYLVEVGEVELAGGGPTPPHISPPAPRAR